MRRANALGYLTSDYDNYTDILPLEAGKTPDSSHDHLPGAAVQNADGSKGAETEHKWHIAKNVAG